MNFSLEKRTSMIRGQLETFLLGLETVGLTDSAATKRFESLLKEDFPAFERACTDTQQTLFADAWREFLELLRTMLGEDAMEAALVEIRHDKRIN